MASGIAQTSIHIPQVSGVIERPRLLAQLRTASAQKLMLICAPPGYGKTTLAAQFASHTASEVVWHTIEDRERDVPNLFHGLITTLSAHVPAPARLFSTPAIRARSCAISGSSAVRRSSCHRSSRPGSVIAVAIR